MDPELDAARAEVTPLLRLDPDVAEQPHQERAVDLRVAGGLLRDSPAELRGQLLQLAVSVAPFAHSVEGKEMLATGGVQPAARSPVGQRFLEELPQLEPRKEIGLLVVEALLRLVGRSGALGGPLPRVLH